jgi:hypothetical protein
MKNTIRREVGIAEKVDGRIISYASEVPCDLCGKICTVRYFEMRDGSRFGKDCAWIVDFMSKQPEANFTRANAYFFRANKKQLAYMGL